MTLVALLSAGFILGLVFNIWGLLGLSLLIIPTYFIGSLHLGLLQAAASALLSVTIFELGYFCGLMSQGRPLRGFASGPNWVSRRRRSSTIGGLNGFPKRQTPVARPPSFSGLLSQFHARATRLLVNARQIWNERL
jgi:hypothetical protein